MEDVKVIINRTLDTIKEREKLSETELGPHLGVNQSTIWRWRQGRSLCPAARILIPHVYDLPKPAA
jgi:hypothetical protein